MRLFLLHIAYSRYPYEKRAGGYCGTHTINEKGARMAREESLQSTHAWLAALAEEFGISPALVRELIGDILELTADVAHNGPSLSLIHI